MAAQTQQFDFPVGAAPEARPRLFARPIAGASVEPGSAQDAITHLAAANPYQIDLLTDLVHGVVDDSHHDGSTLGSHLEEEAGNRLGRLLRARTTPPGT